MIVFKIAIKKKNGQVTQRLAGCSVLFCFVLFYLSQRVILCDSVPFSEYAENVFQINCLSSEEFAAAIDEVECFLRNKDLFFAQPENFWVKELFSRNKNSEDSAELTASADAYATFQSFSFGEEKSRECILKRLDEAISQGKFVDFCEKFKFFVINRQPQISYYVIEEFFYKHLTQPDLSPEERLFNKQLHNLYLRDFQLAMEQFETRFHVNKNRFHEEMTKIYMDSWQLQVNYLIPWDMALHMALKQYLIRNILTDLFFETTMTELFTASTREEYEERLIAIAEIYIPIYSYLEDYNTAQDTLSILRYWQKLCCGVGCTSSC